MSGSSKRSSRLEHLTERLIERVVRLARQLRHPSAPQRMTAERLSALSVIARQGPVSITALAEAEQVRPATISRMISALVAEGLARREDDEADGRGVLITLTHKGRREFQRARAQRLARLEAALTALSPEQRQALQALVTLLDGLTEAMQSKPPPAR